MASDLRVISRTSASRFTGTDKKIKTIPEIGAVLGADYILEGSIRWARTEGGASRVRATLRLIRVSDDVHVWSETFDRDRDLGHRTGFSFTLAVDSSARTILRSHVGRAHEQVVGRDYSSHFSSGSRVQITDFYDNDGDDIFGTTLPPS